MSFYAYERRRSMPACLINGVPSAVIMGTLFTGLDIGQGARARPALFAQNIGFLYGYHALQCPLEELHGRSSSLHNFIAGATLGGTGVAMRRIGVPFVPPSYVYYGPLPPAVVGGLTYGSLAFLMATFLSGKSI
jgi:hypothetical protein